MKLQLKEPILPMDALLVETIPEGVLHSAATMSDRRVATPGDGAMALLEQAA